MNVTIFGGANPQNDGTSYEDALRLGKKLAETGHAILTGGYVSESARHLLSFAGNVDEAFELLDEYFRAD